MDKVPKKKTVSFNFGHAVFSFFDFLTLEVGINRSSQNISVELPFYAI